MSRYVLTGQTPESEIKAYGPFSTTKVANSLGERAKTAELFMAFQVYELENAKELRVLLPRDGGSSDEAPAETLAEA